MVRTKPPNGNGKKKRKDEQDERTTSRPDMLGNQYAKGNDGGRPEAHIDWDMVNKLCAIQCTGAEIASVIGVHYDTLAVQISKYYGMSFPEYLASKQDAGRVSLRRKQWKAAVEHGNTAMLIWLGKQHLGQKEPTQRTELTGRNGGPIELERRYHLIQQVINDPEAQAQVIDMWRERITDDPRSITATAGN